MVSELLTEADEEFQQGHFEQASKLYSQALEKTDSSDLKELAVLLQKLGDSDYAREEYQAACQSYERLVALHADQSFSGKDRVSVLLKAAKSLNKMSRLDEAESNFQAAYDLAAEALAPGHFLVATVKDSFAEFLLEHGRKPELLKQLFDQLGVVPEEKKEEIEERKPEEIVVPTAAKPAAEKEVFVLRTKLTRKSKKEDEEEKAREKLTAKKLTVEQEVAERKFLRKKAAQETSQALSSSRAKLRNTMAKDHGSGSGVNEVTASGEFVPATTESIAAVSAQEAANTQSQLETLYPAISEMMQPSEGAANPLSKLAGKKPQRSLRSKRTGVDLVVRDATAPMPEASKSFLQQAEAIKKSSDEEILPADLVALRSNKKADAKPISHHLGHSVKLLPPLLGLLMLVGLAAFYAINAKNSSHGKQTPLFVVNLQGHTYSSADGTISLAFSSKNDLSITAAGHHRNIKPKLWRGSFNDELSLLQGGFKDCRWMIEVPEGLRDSDGVTLYSEEAPERKVILFMKQAGDEAQQYYAQKGKFPALVSELTQNSYTNPFTNKPTFLQITSSVDNKNTDASKEAALDVELQNGAPFKKEDALSPGAVHAASISGRPHYLSDQNEYEWDVQSYYIHGADRNGKFISGTDKNKVFVVSIKNGVFKQPDDQAGVTAYGVSDICICENEIPDKQGIIFKYVGILLAIVFAIAFFAIRRHMPTMIANTASDRNKKFVIPD